MLEMSYSNHFFVRLHPSEWTNGHFLGRYILGTLLSWLYSINKYPIRIKVLLGTLPPVGLHFLSMEI